MDTKVGTVGIRRPLARNNNTTAAEQLGGPIRHLLWSDGYRHHSVHSHCPCRYPPSHHQATETDARDERTSTPLEGYTDPIRGRSDRDFQTNHGHVQGSRGQSHRLLGPIRHPNAHTVRVVPSVDSDTVLAAGQPGRSVGKVVHLATGGTYLRGGAPGGGFPVAGLGGAGPNEPDHPRACLRVDLAPAKDDHDPVGRPQAEHQSDHDALDDAANDRLFLVHIAQWPGPLLDFFERNGNRHPIFCYRVAAYFPLVSQA